MSDWGQRAIGVGPAVAALVHLLPRTRVLAAGEREVVGGPVRWDDALPRRRAPHPGAGPEQARLDDERSRPG